MKFDAFASMFRIQAVGQDDSTAVPTSDIVLFTNQAKDEIAREVVTNVEGGADWFSISLTTDLVADQRSYAFPDDVLKNIKVCEAYINGEWKRLKPFDLNSYRVAGDSSDLRYGDRASSSFSDATLDETTITEQFTDDNPMFDMDGREIVIYSATISTVTDGLKLKAMIYPSDYDSADFSTDTDMAVRQVTTETVMPRQTHSLMLRKAVIDYKESKDIPLSAFDKNYMVEKESVMDSLRNINLDETTTAKLPANAGFDY